MIAAEDWKDLNEAYYELYGRLFENMELVDEIQADITSEA